MTPTWCPGCGNFALWTALNHVFERRGIAPHEAAVVFDIGCSSNGSNWIKAYTFHGLHGRSIPLGTGISLANHGLTTIVVSGDGGAYGEGIGHLVAALRANANMTLIVEDNQLYALTKGQTSPTSPDNFHSSSTPFGATDEPINPIALAVATDGSFIARGFAGDLPHLESILDQAIAHEGFSYVDVFQPCVTFNHLDTYAHFYDLVRRLEDMQHDPTDKAAAWQQANEMTKYLPIGVFLKQSRPTLQSKLPQLAKKPLADQPLSPPDITELLKHHA